MGMIDVTEMRERVLAKMREPVPDSRIPRRDEAGKLCRDAVGRWIMRDGSVSDSLPTGLEALRVSDAERAS